MTLSLYLRIRAYPKDLAGSEHKFGTLGRTFDAVKRNVVQWAMRRVLSYLWASPNTAIGLVLCTYGVASGAKIQFRDGVVECYGAGIGQILRSRIFRAQALTLGHVVLARGPVSLDAFRTHELVHVRQYEQLGPFFLPAYALASLYAAITGRHFYRDNVFEVDARRYS